MTVYSRTRRDLRRRIVNTAVLVALVLLLTPCCELLAAGPASDMPAHSHHSDDAAPAGEHCVPWLEQQALPAGGAALFASAPAAPDSVISRSPVFAAGPPRTVIALHAGAPPPGLAVYLRTSRLRL